MLILFVDDYCCCCLLLLIKLNWLMSDDTILYFVVVGDIVSTSARLLLFLQKQIEIKLQLTRSRHVTYVTQQTNASIVFSLSLANFIGYCIHKRETNPTTKYYTHTSPIHNNSHMMGV